MKTMDMKRSFKFIICLCTFLLCNTNLYAYDFEADGVYYNITSAENLEVSVTAKAYPAPTETYVGDFVIPAYVTYSEKEYSVKSIESYAFGDCKKLTSITLPNTVTTIGMYAFQNCSSLASIELPNSITSIGSAAFFNCSGLTSITLPSSITSIEGVTFSHCSSLTSIDLPNSITSIGHQAFYGCSSLTSISLPNNITSIGYGAFDVCRSLTSIELPNSITSIGDFSFYECNNLELVVSDIINPFAIDDHVFHNNIAILQVPKGTKELYQQTSGWTEHFKYVVEEGENIHRLTINAVGNGNVSSSDLTSSVKDGAYSQLFPEGTDVTLQFYPDNGYYLESIKINNEEKVMEVNSSNELLVNMSSDIIAEANFAVKPAEIYTLTIESLGNGSVIYGEKVIRESKSTFSVEEGSSVTLTFSPDEGYKLYDVIIGNGSYMPMVKNNQLTLSSITENMVIEVLYPYALSIKASGNGRVKLIDTEIRDSTAVFTLCPGESESLLFFPDEGYRVKSLIVNDVDVTTDINSINQYTINKIDTNTVVETEFELIPIPTYSLSIKSSGKGVVQYDEITVRDTTSTFIVEEGTSATITLTPDEGFLVQSLMVNNTEVTSDITNNQYTINDIKANTTVEAKFRIKDNLANDGIAYKVVSEDDRTVTLDKGDYGLCIEVPSSFTAYNIEWTITGVEEGVLENETTLAAIIWNPEYQFNGKPSNPNLLLYVKSEEYAPSIPMNVVVDEKAKNITLEDGSTTHNFYCPEAFVAEQISYVHNYSMKSGFNTCQGWESIVLPFDVATVTSKTGTQLVPYSLWKYGDNTRPFWLYSMNEDGWKSEPAIKANIPYVISMPNNENYNATYNQSGDVVFSASNVEVKASDEITNSKYGQRIFVPNYQHQKSSSDIFALNVNNSIYTYTEKDPVEGSAFIRELRDVGPFEAYMMIEGNVSATRSVSIFGDDDTTGIMDLPMSSNHYGNNKVYSLSGRLIKQAKDDRDIQDLPKGVYIINGNKVIK